MFDCTPCLERKAAIRDSLGLWVPARADAARSDFPCLVSPGAPSQCPPVRGPRQTPRVKHNPSVAGGSPTYLRSVRMYSDPPPGLLVGCIMVPMFAASSGGRRSGVTFRLRVCGLMVLILTRLCLACGGKSTSP